MAKTEATQVAPKKHFDFTALNTLAVVSLATAVTGFGAIAGIITGHIALTQIKQSGQAGRGLAIAGLAIGYAGIALGILVGVGKVALAIWGFRNGMPIDGPGMMGNRWGNY
ncbi:MAG: DUF4190 domain-containing protein [Micrococcales bacterium]